VNERAVTRRHESTRTYVPTCPEVLTGDLATPIRNAFFTCSASAGEIYRVLPGGRSLPTASPYTRLAVPVLIAVAVAMSGCTDDDRSTINDLPPSVAQTGASPSSGSTAGSVESELVAAQQTYYESYLAALGAPGDAELVGRLLELYMPGSPERANVDERMRSFAERGVAGRPGPESYYVIENIDVIADPPDGRAEVTFCGFDDGVLYDTRQRAPDGREIVVNDDPYSGRTRTVWIQESGTWSIESVVVVDTWEGENRCPPAEPS
jgi:hypothetical protein